MYPLQDEIKDICQIYNTQVIHITNPSTKIHSYVIHADKREW